MKRQSTNHFKLILAMVVLMFAMMIPVTSRADVEGNCGASNASSIHWVYVQSAKTIIFGGSGDMANYTAASPAPWHSLDIEKVEINSGINSIGDYAFAGCANLKQAVIPDSVKGIGSYAFASCQKLTKATLSSTSKCITISSHAFDHCTSLAGFTIPASVKFISEYAFYDSDLDVITLPSTVQTVGQYAFAGSSVCNADINVKYISNNAFDDTYFLEDVTLGSNVLSIGSCAFYNCDNLETVSIPSTVKSIGAYAFGFHYADPSLYEKNSGFNIVGKTGTTAFTYAKNYSVEFCLDGLTAPTNVSAYNTSGKKIKVKWTKDKKYTGYQICYSLKSGFTSKNKYITIRNYKTTSRKTAKLTKNKTYYVRIRGYKKISGKYCYSSWSSTKKVKIKK